MGRLDGRIAIVTGGARGIGRAIVEAFAHEGAHVTSFDVSEAGAETPAHQLPRGAVESMSVDVTREAHVQHAVEAVVRRHGTVDILVNNAGVNAYFDATTMSEAEWESVFAVDLKGAWLCAKHVLPWMIRSSHGAIVNISSIHATLTMEGMFPYAAAKSGMVGLTRSLALDYAPLGIRINAILPGWTETRLVEEWFERQPDPAAARARVVEAHPMKRLAKPEEVASLVVFAVSDEASAITGASLAVDCGLSVKFAV